ncbi:MAG: cyanophycin synthetase [Bacteriovorax sp.]|nr:cyanophycin synthetase [Bacteriovorax sp.]
MKILDIRTISGPNVYHHRPVLIMSLDLESLAEKASTDISGFTERLISLLPGLKNHHCSPRHSGGFVERLKKGTYFAHIIEHIALELSEGAGIGVSYGKSIYSGTIGKYLLITRYRCEEGMKFLLQSAVKLAEKIVAGEIFDLDACLKDAKNIISRNELGPSTKAILDAAKKRNIPWRRLNDESLIQLGYGVFRQFIQATTTSMTSDISVDIAQDKNLTKKLLEEASIRVPRGRPAYSLEDAREIQEEIPVPLAVKPLDGNHGRGVSLHISTFEDMEAAFNLARIHSDIVLIEECLKGKDYRILIVGGKMVAASERVPAHVVGDGELTLGELIDNENRNPLRGLDHEKPLTKITVNVETMALLNKSGITLKTIPKKNEYIFLKETANLSTGGSAIDMTDEIHPEVQSMCERAARIVGLDICGVDLIAEDIRLPMSVQSAGVIEVNAGPGLRMHQHPSFGIAREVGAAIINNLYPNNTNGRIPIVAITGTNGKTTVARLLSHIVAASGRCVGTTTTDGIYINNIQVAEGDTTGPISARTVLTDPSVELAVLETARGGIVKRGLGYDWSDVGIFTNLKADHIGQDGIECIEDILKIKSLVIERVKTGGAVILNADSKEIVGLTLDPRTDMHTKKLTYFSLDENNIVIKKHMANAGHAYFMRDGEIIEAQGQIESTVIHINEIPLTLGGTAYFHAANVMAAIAAAHAINISDAIILQSLISFNQKLNLGRTNLYKIGRGYLLLDYGHNPDAIQVIGEMGKRWNVDKLTGVIAAPGDRVDEIIKLVGEASAKAFNKVIIREDLDLRGREKGKVAEILRQSIIAKNPRMNCRIVLNSEEALRKSIDEMQANELVVFFYEELKSIENLLMELGATPSEDASLFIKNREERSVRGDGWLQFSY